MQPRHLAFILTIVPLLLFAQSPPQKLIFVSDTQSPIWFEKIYVEYNDNEAATQKIFSSILEESNLTAVIHAGDITAYGSSRDKWEPVLPFLDSLRARSVPFVAAKGNHDYMFSSAPAMENFREYITGSPSDYSLSRFGPVAVIFLNSNFSKLDDSTIVRQNEWYAATLSKCDADSTVRFICCVNHHSPFTNSAIVSGSEEVQKYFLPEFYHSRKARLFVSGHAHRFEHFRNGGKDFLVIGGGGGLLHPRKSSELLTDLSIAGEEGRFFHYVRCLVGNDSLSFEIVKVASGSAHGEVVYTMSVTMPDNP